MSITTTPQTENVETVTTVASSEPASAPVTIPVKKTFTGPNYTAPKKAKLKPQPIEIKKKGNPYMSSMQVKPVTQLTAAEQKKATIFGSARYTTCPFSLHRITDQDKAVYDAKLDMMFLNDFCHAEYLKELALKDKKVEVRKQFLPAKVDLSLLGKRFTIGKLKTKKSQPVKSPKRNKTLIPVAA